MKESNHKISLTIQTSPAAAWEIIGAVNGVDKWLAPITSCRVEGDKRYCTTEQGEFAEDIRKVDHENRILQYTIPSQNMIPVQNIEGEMRVLTAENGKTTIEWSWNYDVEEVNEASAKEALTMVGTMGIQGIEALVNNAAVAG